MKVLRKRTIQSTRILYPWKMVGRFEDDFEIEVGGNDEEDCMWRLAKLQDKHGDLIWYSGVSDDDYVDGEYIGSSSKIRCSQSSHRVNKHVYSNTSPAGTLLYRNKRNENKYIEVKKSSDGHTEFRQFMYWVTDDGPVKNYNGSKTNRGRFHRVRQGTLNSILDDYEQVDGVHTELDRLDD